MRSKTLVILLLLALANAVGMGLTNLKLSHDYPSGNYVVANEGITIYNQDNEYYLDPVDNYLAGKGWRRSPPLGNGSYYRRTPGYSILYFLATKATGNSPTGKFYVVVGAQVLLYLLSVLAIWCMVPMLTPSKWAQAGTTLVFAVLPYVSSYTFMTVTESLYPHFLVYYLYWVLRAYYDGKYLFPERTGAFVLAAVFLTFSILTRPVTGILGLILVVLYLRALLRGPVAPGQWAWSMACVVAVPVVLVGAWTARNYVLTKDFVPLEVAYHPQSHDRMKPEFKGLFTFVKTWGEDGAAMNEWQIPLLTKTLVDGDTSIAHVDAILARFPPQTVGMFGRPRLRSVLRQYQSVTYSLKQYYDRHVPMPAQYSRLQLDTQSRFDSLTREYAQRFPLKYYVGVPLIYLKRAVFNSGTSNSYLFQEPFRSHSVLVMLRLLFLVVHIAAYFCILFNAWSFRHDAARWVVFCLVPLLYLGFFVVYFQEIEQRYLLPSLVLALLGLHRPLALLEHRFARRPALA